jgi:hypothetical protein
VSFALRTHKTYVLTPSWVAPLPNFILAGCAIALPVAIRFVICFALPVTRSHCRLRYLLCHFGLLVASPYRPICVVRYHYVGVTTIKGVTMRCTTNRIVQYYVWIVFIVQAKMAFCARQVTVHMIPNSAQLVFRQGWAFTHPTHGQSESNACRTFNEQLDLKKKGGTHEP